MEKFKTALGLAFFSWLIIHVSNDLFSHDKINSSTDMIILSVNFLLFLLSEVTDGKQK
jgi:hypothetical protein